MNSEVAEASKNESWISASSPQPANSSQVNTIRTVGCADEGLWFFSLDDSAKHRRTVSCDQSWPETYEQADEHELMIDSGCFGHVCLPWFAPQFPAVSASNVDAAANNVVVQHYGQNVVYGHVTTADKFLIQVTFDVSVRQPLLSTSALKRRRIICGTRL